MDKAIKYKTEWKKYKAEARKIGYLFLAAAVVLVLHCKIQIIEAYDSSASEVVHFIGKLSNFFTSYNLTDLFVWAAAYFMIRYVSLRDRSVDKWSALLSALFSVSYVLSNSYMTFNSTAFLTRNRYQLFLSGFCMYGFFVLFYFCIRMILIFLDEHSGIFVREHAAQNLRVRFLPISFSVILLCWLPWILMNYPGSFCPDSQAQLRQFFGDATFTAHHPPLSTYIMGTLVVIGDFLVDKNFGCFLYLLLQTCMGAWVFSAGVKKLYVVGLRFRYCFLMILFYALAPFWGCFVQWYEKDLLYTEAATLFLIHLIDIVIKRECTKRDAEILAAAGVLASLLRNNGIYAVLPVILLLAFYVGRRFRKAIWISLFCTILIYGCFVKIIFPSVLGIKNGSVKEALSIPFQQTARYVVAYGDEVTEYEKDVIDSVLDYDSLVEKYDPVISDPVKGMYKEDGSKLPEYFKVWFQMFLKHPGIYISAVLNGSYGYIAPVQTNIEAGILTDFGERYSYLTGIGIHRIFDELPTSVFTYIRNIGLNVPLVKYLSMPGMYSWITMTCAVIFLKEKKYGFLIILVPEFMNILVCIASPLSNAIRYELPVAAAVPLLIGWTYILGFKKDVTISSEETKILRLN
ncbi:MAG: hypothetical protein HDR03_11400 [Lachnospiraceae bacterium]|nr:hypothetical protein [Lachnospiraceae bacterium]